MQILKTHYHQDIKTLENKTIFTITNVYTEI